MPLSLRSFSRCLSLQCWSLSIFHFLRHSDSGTAMISETCRQESASIFRSLCARAAGPEPSRCSRPGVDKRVEKGQA
ncbi:hypothetical protein EYF80_024362 [Liparis tanakae]|uniref:Uncharacterized protein n=1 Tax=Liparis tanakae TaxID=230148 RepID=A0A4Z2HKR0_9TELE|nr:hypothetical protein EYF80_024362 [Liparis tanakae]